MHVKRGQFIAYMGDSGEAETTDPHLHFELHRPDDTFIDPYTSLRLAQGAGANGLCGIRRIPLRTRIAAAGPGFWTLNADGTVLGFGTVPKFGSAPSHRRTTRTSRSRRRRPARATGRSTRTAQVHAFGNAHNYGGADTLHLNQPVLGIAPTTDGKGYWLLARDGGIFSYGDAQFYGSTGAMALNAPGHLDGIDTRSGHGYWLLAADGGVFSFGNANFLGLDGCDQARGAGHVDDRDADRQAATCCWRATVVCSASATRSSSVRCRVSGWCPGPTALAFVADTRRARLLDAALRRSRSSPFGNAKTYGGPITSHATAVALAAAR